MIKQKKKTKNIWHSQIQDLQPPLKMNKRQQKGYKQMIIRLDLKLSHRKMQQKTSHVITENTSFRKYNQSWGWTI